MKDHLVLRVVARFLIPFILLFALYIQLHGEYSPGGGFQAGVIFAAGYVLYCLIFGLKSTQSIISTDILRILACMGVLLYAGTGVVTMLYGSAFLDYDVLFTDPVVGQKIGILVIELGVGITVFSAMMLLFFLFLERKENQ